VVIVGARIIGTPSTRDVGPLHVAATSVPGHDPHSAAFGHDGAPTTEIVLNPHSVAVDDADLPVWSKVRRPTAPQRYCAPAISAVALTSATTRCVCATVVTGISTSIAGSVSAAVVRRVSATVTTRVRSATAGVPTAIAVVPGTTHRSARGPARLSAWGTPLAMRVFVTRTRSMGVSARVALVTGAAWIIPMLNLPPRFRPVLSPRKHRDRQGR
jgi:hypothetical protein